MTRFTGSPLLMARRVTFSRDWPSLAITVRRCSQVPMASKWTLELTTKRHNSWYKRNLERIAYSLRQKYRESHHVKTKIVFSSYKLRLRIRDKNNTSWINLDNQAAALYMDTEVIFKPEEAPREGIPTVKQFYTSTLEALD